MQDIGKTDYDLEVEKYIHDNYVQEDADWFCSLFEDSSEIFVERYDDEYIWLDIWEHRFLWHINNPEEFPLLTPEAEDMLQLMPNDMVDQWHLMKKKNERMLFITYNEYDFLSLTPLKIKVQ